MDVEVKHFIENHIDLIEDEKFKELYKILRDKLTSIELVSEFTETLLSAGIDPADYMEEIPPHYLGYLEGRNYIQSYIIPNNITSIGSNAFSYCSNLTTVTIGNGVKSIGNSAFNNCSGLTSVTIGNSVTSIGNGAFACCSKLANITIPDSVISIGGSAFYGCGSLTSIIIPDSVTKIDKGVFRRCDKLDVITYLGTKDQWNKIKKLSEWRKDSHIKKIKCKDGVIELK